MDTDLLTALALFAFVTSVTPGPNNLMLVASGANFGFRRTLPHMLGIGIGFALMVFAVGAGLIGLFDRYPVSHTILTALSIVYMLWLAWKTATAAGIKPGDQAGKPMTFLQAAAFQWVNPKAWAMALTAITAYAPDRSLWAIAGVAVIFGAVNLPTVSSWTILGQQMARLLQSDRHRRAFNITMAVLLLASLVPVLRV